MDVCHQAAVTHLINHNGEAVGPLIDVWSVHLIRVSHEHDLGILTDTGNDSLELMDGGILSLVNDHECIAECPTPNVGERRDLDESLAHHHLKVRHILEGVPKVIH